MKNIVKYKNTFEVKAIGFLALLVIISSISAMINGFKSAKGFDPFALFWLIPIIFVCLVVFVFARYKCQFDFEKRIITNTPYLKKSKKYSFDEVKMIIGNYDLGKNYNESYKDLKMIKFVDKDNNLLVKFSDNQFEVKAKEKIGILINEFGNDEEKRIYSFYEELLKLDCFAYLISFNHIDTILSAYSRDVNVNIGYKENMLNIVVEFTDSNAENKIILSKEYEVFDDSTYQDMLSITHEYIKEPIEEEE